jgi:hypothetical protein
VGAASLSVEPARSHPGAGAPGKRDRENDRPAEQEAHTSVHRRRLERSHA